MTPPTQPSSTAARRQRDREPGLASTLALYTLARVAVVAVIAGLLTLAGVPVLIALLVALIVALPLSMVLFRGLRARLDRAIAVRTARRGAERDALRAQLRGEQAPPDAPEAGAAGSGQTGDGEPDRGRD